MAARFVALEVEMGMSYHFTEEFKGWHVDAKAILSPNDVRAIAWSSRSTTPGISEDEGGELGETPRRSERGSRRRGRLSAGGIDIQTNKKLRNAMPLRAATPSLAVEDSVGAETSDDARTCQYHG